MSDLILIRHSQSRMDLQQPARLWQLTNAGRQRCQALAAALAPYQLDRIITSREPKAAETGRLAAEILNIPWQMAPGLHEHERERLPVMDHQAFLDGMAQLFARPDERVLGDESAYQARSRFNQAVAAALASYSGEKLGIVTHGTVLSLCAAQICQMDAYALWQWLDMPAFVVLTHPQGPLLARWKWTPDLEIPG